MFCQVSFHGVEGDVIERPLDVQESAQRHLLPEQRLLYFVYEFVEGCLCRVASPEPMLIILYLIFQVEVNLEVPQDQPFLQFESQMRSSSNSQEKFVKFVQYLEFVKVRKSSFQICPVRERGGACQFSQFTRAREVPCEGSLRPTYQRTLFNLGDCFNSL